VKIKVQAWEPDTCESPGCRILTIWDVEAPVDQREHRIAAFERVCPAHQVDMPVGMLLWWDGNWKPLKEYIEYQRAWFRRLNHVEWLEKNPDEQMPETIRGFTSEPVTTGSLPAPARAKHDGMVKAWGWNQRDNMRKAQAIDAMESEMQGFDRDKVVAKWSGKGESRKLIVSSGGQINEQVRQRVAAIMDIQHGVGHVTIEV
jgi:hypothetical protein